MQMPVSINSVIMYPKINKIRSTVAELTEIKNTIKKLNIDLYYIDK